MHGALQRAKRILLVLSPAFLEAKFTEAEWTAALASDPTGANRTVVPVRVRECRPTGLLKPIVYIDLVGLTAEDARKRLLYELKGTTGGRREKFEDAPAASAKAQAREGTGINQSVTGDGNIQVAGDFNNYQQPPVQKSVLERREGAISTSQEREITSWIEKLAENTMGMARKRAFGMWGARFNNRFDLRKRGDLPSEMFSEAEAWYRQQSAILVRKLKTKAPDAWRQARYGSIHKAIDALGIEKEAYYQRVAKRLKMKPFASLKELTKRDLDRVYTMALRDLRKE
jgi:hypothetical protein